MSYNKTEQGQNLIRQHLIGKSGAEHTAQMSTPSYRANGIHPSNPFLFREYFQQSLFPFEILNFLFIWFFVIQYGLIC